MLGMSGSNPYVVASLELISILSWMLNNPKEAKDDWRKAYLGQQAWIVLGCLGAQRMEESHAGIFSPRDQVVEGVIPLATSYNPHGEHGWLHYVVSGASTYALAREQEGDDIYVDEYLDTAQAAIEFLLHVSLAARWVGSMALNLGEADHGYMPETKAAMEESGEAAQIALLLKQAGEYEQWAVDQIEAGEQVAAYLVTTAGHLNWMLNKLLELKLIGFVPDEENPSIGRTPQWPLSLTVQQRENFPDWLFKLLTRAKLVQE